jgi:hypothetical protein
MLYFGMTSVDFLLLALTNSDPAGTEEEGCALSAQPR